MYRRCSRGLLYERFLQRHGFVRAQSTVAASQKPRPDPFKTLAPKLAELRTDLISMLGSGHPAINEIAKYYFLHPSKQVRPVIVLLLAQATNGLGSDWNKKLWEAECENAGGRQEELNRPLSRPDVLNDWNPSMPANTANFDPKFAMHPAKPHRPPKPPPAYSNASVSRTLANIVLPTQRRLAQIVEMMHTASLLHDDVIDESALRRGAASAPASYGNKLSVLGGNFVLGRASAALSRLGDGEVMELISSVLPNLVEGEILQLREIKMDDDKAAVSAKHDVDVAKDILEKNISGQRSRDAWNIYLQKTYLKTASLMAKGARSAVVLGGCKEGEVWKEIAYAYGRNLGIAFQLVDDVLDYESASATLGKPGGADLQLGLATGPALYAWEEFPEIGDLIQRKFDRPGDVELARDYVLRSSGVQRTRALAQAYADKAKEVLQELPDSEAKAGLEVLTERVIGRKS
ncbi:putative hexaprenyl pyrophosphate synthase, mitochondrial [Psilocybe cubensis]|uniref:(2E,6E)-farnesyl diphosphate synthase n=2 Tax=Psilocybe cubensis TaxID=181762 RepID=A0A8H8CI01_PSICU|nr:putative hexaprenyl pyrophosphate synthase, mitochondrial [Psilocybe cubensis]KAH9475831.1 putative hexaprenyl pyrophosphate synthase, mitochondrial [Psilocybe cubensis]